METQKIVSTNNSGSSDNDLKYDYNVAYRSTESARDVNNANRVYLTYKDDKNVENGIAKENQRPQKKYRHQRHQQRLERLILQRRP